MSLQKVISSIRKNKTFLITAHTGVEGDALGSELAFWRLLRALGKRAYIINDGIVPAAYDFLPDISSVKQYSKNLKPIHFDCAVLLDCSGLERCARVARLIAKEKMILNIDHHASNKKFARVNWVEPGASSCCQMIYRLYKKMGVHFDRRSALQLYTGILTDTGSFRYPNTNSLTHRAVSELITYGINVSRVYQRIYGNIPYEKMKLLCREFSAMRRSVRGRIAYFELKVRASERKDASFDMAELILNFARALKGVEAAIVFKVYPGPKKEVKVNLRSQGSVDVNRVATRFGGGGHRTASGCTLYGKIGMVKRKIIAAVREQLK